MAVNHVNPGDPISARKWNEIVDKLNRADLTQAALMVDTRVTVGNYSSSTVTAGQIVAVSGMRGAGDGAQQCFRNFLENGFQLLATPTGDSPFLATMEEAVRPAGGGNLIFCGKATLAFHLAAGFVLSKSSTGWPTKVKAIVHDNKVVFEFAEDGEWSVVGVSNPVSISDGDYVRKFFAYLSPEGGRPWVSYYRSDGTLENTKVTSIKFGTGSTDVFQGARDQNNPSVVTITGAKYYLSGATSPVTNVTVDSNGDIVLERNPITLSKYF